MRDIDIDIYRGSYSQEYLQSLRRKLAKRANQRIVRLENATSKVTGERYNAFGAVTDAYEYLERQGRNRFSEVKNVKYDFQKLKHEITVLQGFLGRPTSTVKGMRDIENKRVNTFESGKWGTRYNNSGIPMRPIKFASTKEFYEFLGSQTFSALVASGFTSEQVIEIYDEAREGGKSDESVRDELDGALQEYRRKGNANLKDLRNRMKSKKLKGSGNK